MNNLLINYIKNIETIFEEIKISNKNVFYTALFKYKRKVDIPNKFIKNKNWDYIIFTNINNLDTLIVSYYLIMSLIVYDDIVLLSWLQY